jgi:anthranilate synthase component 2
LILVVDNFDSFTWNLVHYLRELGTEVRVARNDELGAAEALASGAEAILISPGPGTCQEAGVTLDLVAACAQARRPLLGVCLGHQAIGMHFGGIVDQAAHVMHGKTSPIAHDGAGVFAGLPSPFTAARYHSLVVVPASVPACLAVTATAADDGTVQGLRHRELPIHGVQFHPESIATEHGHRLLGNFLEMAGVTRQGAGGAAGARLRALGTAPFPH